MSLPQPGLFIEETAVHCHTEFRLTTTDLAAVSAALTAARRAANFLRGPNTVWGFAPSLWSRLAPHTLPTGLTDFVGIYDAGPDEAYSSPSTQGSIWFWCHGNEHSKVWQASERAASELESVATMVSTQNCYIARDDRDPIGFIDGTENPALDEAVSVSVVAEGPGAGGVPVLVQKWVHDLDSFWRLPQAEQEGVIGRTKADSVELPEDVMPATSHVSRNVLTTPTGELHIYRRNTPFADLTEAGTMFVGCSADPSRVLTMLDRMFGVTEDGLIDDLIRFSTPVSGSMYFAPPLAALTELFGELAPDDDEDDAAEAAADGNESKPRLPGSLGLGSLR